MKFKRTGEVASSHHEKPIMLTFRSFGSSSIPQTLGPVAVVFKVWHQASQLGTMADLQAGGLFTNSVAGSVWHHVGPSIESLKKGSIATHVAIRQLILWQYLC